MRRMSIFKLSIIGVLILISIAQTAILWLGPMPSQNFFNPIQTSYQGIEPFGVWLVKPSASNVGNVSSLAYRLDHTINHTKREYEHLVKKMQVIVEQLERRSSNVTLQEQEINWNELFAKPSIVYEYEAPLNLSDIGGLPKSAYKIGKVDTLVIQAQNGFTKGIQVYLISTLENKMYQATLEGNYKEIDKIYNYFTADEILSNITKYQPSSLTNISKYIEGNAFMAIASEHTPLVYEVLEVTNPLKMTDTIIQDLERYVDDFFVNPLLKDSEMKEDGTVIFTEQNKNVVIYHPEGVLEYINLSPDKKSIQTNLTGYQQAMAFMKSTEALSPVVKDGLYLERIEEKNQGATYYFNVSYDGHKVILSEGIKEKLGIKELVQITVKNNQITNCVMPILDIDVLKKNGYPTKAKLTVEYLEPMNKALAYIAEQSSTDRVFQDVDTMYVITTTQGNIYMQRGIYSEGNWYYP